MSGAGGQEFAHIAGLDVGDKRIGVAVSDGLGMTAQPLGVVARKSVVRDIEAIVEMLAEYDVSRIVAGLPLQMDATEGAQVDRVRSFCTRLSEQTGIEVVYQDERLTSVESERLLIESGMQRKKRRQVIDKMAAAIILQAHLDARSYGSA